MLPYGPYHYQPCHPVSRSAAACHHSSHGTPLLLRSADTSHSTSSTHSARSTSTSFSTLYVSAAHFTNPSPLPARYEIVKLSLARFNFCKAICCHAEFFHVPMLTATYKRDMSVFWRLLDSVYYLIQHQLQSGLSYGVIDTQYVYKRMESEASGGRLYWDDRTALVDDDALAAGMDFPLVSIAMSHDQFHQFDSAKLAPIHAAVPLLAKPPVY